eukprot:12063335-Alexandrium_andersonii.AAC.1
MHPSEANGARLAQRLDFHTARFPALTERPRSAGELDALLGQLLDEERRRDRDERLCDWRERMLLDPQ